ncbi:MAG: polysaccharide deacetylase [Firmicutes bacterium]|nr:polysaccharide deacetylase [Bacillota bacterium]MTI70012.1 polysaccharide deacetylase [Bacillota bacterium]
MKIFYIKYKTLYKIIIICILLVTILGLTYIYNKKTVNTFNNKDVYYKGNVDEKIIAFTCNIDWGNEYIPKMLDIFEKNNIKITFFPTGRWADKNRALIKLISARGHEIGNHGYYHKDYSKLSYNGNKKEIYQTDILLKEITNTTPKYFAPPAGAYNKNTIKAANDLNYKIIMWSIDTIDWRKDSTSDKITNRVIKKANNSAIVLMHPKEQTVKALPSIIKILKQKGYEIGRVSDVIINN